MKKYLCRAVGGVLIGISILLIGLFGRGMLQGGRLDMCGLVKTAMIIGIPMVLGTVILLAGIRKLAIVPTYGIILAMHIP